MAHRDPDNELVTNPNDPCHRGWGSGSATATIVAMVIMIGIIAYGATTATKTPPNGTTLHQRCIIGLLVKLTPVLSKVA
jgi:hypothetical protein